MDELLELWANFEPPTPLERCETMRDQWEHMYRDAVAVPITRCSETQATVEADGSVSWYGTNCHNLFVPEPSVMLMVWAGIILLLILGRLRR